MTAFYALLSDKGVVVSVVWEVTGTPSITHTTDWTALSSYPYDSALRRFTAIQSWSEAWLLKQKLLDYGHDYQIVPYFSSTMREAYQALQRSPKFSRLHFLKKLWIR